MAETSNSLQRIDKFLAKSQIAIGAFAMVVLPYNLIANLGYAPKLDPIFTFIASFFTNIK